MFEDFQKKAGLDGRRFGASLAVAASAFGLFGASMVAATSGVRNDAPEEELVQVEFAPPPEPEAPPPPPPPPPPPEPRPRPERSDRPAVVREELVQPEEITDEELDESDRELSDERDTGGGRDGSTNGTRGGTGLVPAPPAPPPPPPPPPRPSGPIMRPENATGGDMVGGMPPIAYPEAARSSGIQGMVIVKCVITLEGETDDCTVLRGHELLNEAAIANVRARRFTPVRLPDGTAIQVWKIFPVRFQLTNI